MNVYEKLQTARCELQHMQLTKSGKNTFSHYEYYELSDFLPYINDLFKTHKLCNIITFNDEYAELKIINAEKPDEVITVKCPNAEAKLKGCHEIQNLGAVQTYQRRYLYLTALEITESDILDNAMDNKKEVKTLLTKAQVNRLYAIGEKAGVTGRQINDLIKKQLNKEPNELTKTEYEAYCLRLENKAKETEGAQ